LNKGNEITGHFSGYTSNHAGKKQITPSEWPVRKTAMKPVAAFSYRATAAFLRRRIPCGKADVKNYFYPLKTG
jgi:hypothetical protein